MALGNSRSGVIVGLAAKVYLGISRSGVGRSALLTCCLEHHLSSTCFTEPGRTWQTHRRSHRTLAAPEKGTRGFLWTDKQGERTKPARLTPDTADRVTGAGDRLQVQGSAETQPPHTHAHSLPAARHHDLCGPQGCGGAQDKRPLE